MVTVYGADWCEDTQKARRLLRRLGVRHAYLNVDEDLDALEHAVQLNHGRRRTPTIDIDGEVLVEPRNETLTNALLRHAEITEEEIEERRRLQNVGDLERLLRVGGGVLALLVATRTRAGRLPLVALGALNILTGASGWCPLYTAAHASSLEGPGDRPREAERAAWLVPMSD